MIAQVEVPACPRDTTLESLLQTSEGRRILTCMQCGMCAGTCPYGEHMDYPPRRIIALLRRGRIEEVFDSESMLRCVACYACMAKCPRGIRLSDVLLPLVKEQTLARLPEMPAELQRSLENTLRYGNPMGESSRKRDRWTQHTQVPIPRMADRVKQRAEPVDVLWFVECYTSYYPQGIQVSCATARLFHELGVDFAILGNEEKCAGDCGQLTWESGLFETLTDYNMEIFKKYPFRRVVTGDPHAFNALRIRYPLYGFEWPVQHTVMLLAEHLESLQPRLTKRLHYRVTYHDPCCLGRRAGCYEEPRALLAAIPGLRLVEMAHHRANSLCCGGGGGGMWLDTYYKTCGMERLAEQRVREALATGAEVLAVACPYEVFRFEDALKTLGCDDRMIVRDVVELLVEALGD